MTDIEIVQIISRKIGYKFKKTDKMLQKHVCYIINNDEKITKLSLNCCNLMNETIPDEVWELKYLEYLCLSNNMISYFPEKILGFTNLRELYLNGNQIRIVTNNVSKLKKLEILDMACNQLETLPSTIGNLHMLRRLRLNTNRMIFLPVLNSLNQWENLETLELDGADIKELPQWLFELKSLKYLSLSKLHLNRFPEEIARMNKLEGIYLDSTKFPSWPVKIKIPSTLHYIVLDGAYLPKDNKLKLSIIPNAIIELKPQYVNNQNDIDEKSINLQVSLGGNISRNYDKKKLYSVDSEKSYLYLKKLYRTKKSEMYGIENSRLRHIKITLLGCGAVGKTSLVQRLCQWNPDDDNIPLESVQTTHGVNVDYHMYIKNIWDKKMKDYVNFTVNFWDFGGQDKYRGINKLLLTKHSIYIIVLDARMQTLPDVWLEMLKYYVPDSKIILVLNKIDENMRANINFQYYCKKYPQIYSCLFKISCKYQSMGINKVSDIVEAIRKIIESEMDYIAPIIDKKWISINNEIERCYKVLKKDVLSKKEYVDICNKLGVDSRQEQENVLSILNNSGRFISLYDEQFTIINPSWIADYLYVFYNKIDGAKFLMKYKQEYIPMMNKIDKYAEYGKMITEYLESRGLCEIFDDISSRGADKIIFIPMFLENDINTSDIYPQKSPFFQYVLYSETIPEYEYQKFLVKKISRVVKNKYYIWQFGLYYESNNANVAVELMNDGIYIKIWTNDEFACGENIQSIRREILDTAVEGFFKEYIFIESEKGNVFLLYNTLIKLNELGIESYYFPEKEDGYNLILINIANICRKCGIKIRSNNNEIMNCSQGYINDKIQQGVRNMIIKVETVNGNINNYEMQREDDFKTQDINNGDLAKEICDLNKKLNEFGDEYDGLKNILKEIQVNKTSNKTKVKKWLGDWLAQAANVATIGDVIYQNRQAIIKGVQNIYELLS